MVAFRSHPPEKVDTPDLNTAHLLEFFGVTGLDNRWGGPGRTVAAEYVSLWVVPTPTEQRLAGSAARKSVNGAENEAAAPLGRPPSSWRSR